ncbi:MAG: hypothetical protein M3Q07_11405 [Pseudobdellovibrionaceae bacterium]|nr:hypothetical protein [Pseudobdellovibrionaceae bacterium]
MKRPTAFPFSILFLGLFLLHPGCGTDVGNSGKPVTSDTSELALVAGMQHDEVISSVNDGSDSEASALALIGSANESNAHETSPALALINMANDRNRLEVSPTWAAGTRQDLADVEILCTPQTDGSLDVRTTRSVALETEYGRPSQRKVQKDSLATILDMNYAVPATLGVLVCNNNRPVLSWAQLAELKTVAKLEKSRKRSVVLKADGSAVSESELTVASERTVQFAKVSGSSPLESLIVRRTSTLNSKVSLLRKNTDTPITRSVTTLANEPLVLEKTRTRGAGLTRVEIVSGAVVSTHQDARTVILRYKNLVLSTGGSCHPSSGSIEGQVLESSGDTETKSAFTVVFDGDGATLIQADGSEEEIELESCQF